MTRNEEIRQSIREDLYSEWKDLGTKKDGITDHEVDYYLARDRKAAVILKTMDQDLREKVFALKAGQVKQLN